MGETERLNKAESSLRRIKTSLELLKRDGRVQSDKERRHMQNRTEMLLLLTTEINSILCNGL